MQFVPERVGRSGIPPSQLARGISGPQDIAMKVNLGYGERDRNISPAMGRYLAATLPNSDDRFYPSEGHLSLIVNHAEEILGVLVT
jgi:hypothetical protein